jgi:hypothetical protein
MDLARRGHTVWSVDFSAVVIEKMKRLCASSDDRQLEFVVGQTIIHLLTNIPIFSLFHLKLNSIWIMGLGNGLFIR